MTNALVTVDAIRQSEWIEVARLRESAAYELLRIAGIKGEMRRSPGTGRPVRFLLEHQVEALAPLVQRYHDGMSLRQIEEWFKASGGSESSPEAPQASEFRGHPQVSALAREAPGGSGIVPAVPEGSPAWALELVSAIRCATPQAAKLEDDPLKLARRLEEAARLQVPLSQSEIAMLLGVKLGTVEKWRRDHEVRPGFWIRRQFDGSRVWWSVERRREDLSWLPETPGSSATAQALEWSDTPPQ